MSSGENGKKMENGNLRETKPLFSVSRILAVAIAFRNSTPA
jgi:hypothetical protein